MRIIFFTNDYKPQSGGIAEYTYQIAQHFRRKGLDVILLAPEMDGAQEFDRGQSFKTYRYPAPSYIGGLFSFIYYFYIVSVLNVDYTYNAMWFPCGIISLVLGPIFNYKTITAVHAHEAVFSENTLKQKVKKQLKSIQASVLNRMDKIFAVSRYTKCKLVDMGVESDKIKVFNNGVSPEEFKVTDRHERIMQKYDLKDSSVILTVSRLVRHKGHDMVMKSLPKILEEIPNAKYLIAGEGPEKPRLQKIVENLNLEDKVFFVGFIPDEELAQLYNTCDVFIMPSRREGASVEGFGIVFLEANACRKPVVGGNSGGIPDAVVDGETGFLVKPTDVQNIAEALIKVLNNPRLKRKFGKNGYRRVKENFTWDHITDKMLKELRN